MSEPMASHRRIAYHEAGHAVAAVACDRWLEEVVNTGNFDVGGHTRAGPGFGSEGMDQADIDRATQDLELVYGVAGSVAEIIRFGDCNPKAAAFDERDLVPGESRLPDDVRDRYRARVEGLLRDRWRAVEALAARLVPAPVALRGEDAEAIIVEALTAS